MSGKLDPDKRPPTLRWIMIAVGTWGGLLALGAFLFGPDPETGAITLAVNPWRGLIVLSCVGFFLGLWMLLLLGSRRRQGSKRGK